MEEDEEVETFLESCTILRMKMRHGILLLSNPLIMLMPWSSFSLSLFPFSLALPENESIHPSIHQWKASIMRSTNRNGNRSRRSNLRSTSPWSQASPDIWSQLLDCHLPLVLASRALSSLTNTSASVSHASLSASTIHNPNDRGKGPWSPNEHAALHRLVEKYGDRNWSLISKGIPGRSDQAIKAHVGCHSSITPWSHRQCYQEPLELYSSLVLPFFLVYLLSEESLVLCAENNSSTPSSVLNREDFSQASAFHE